MTVLVNIVIRTDFDAVLFILSGKYAMICYNVVIYLMLTGLLERVK